MRIWLDGWFSTAYQFIEMLKNNGHYVIASNVNDYVVYYDVADEFYITPKFEETDDYINWCIDFCKKNSIEVFYPKKHVKDIVLNLERFEANDIIVISEKNIEYYELLEDKFATNNFFKEHNICNTVDMYIVNTVEEFKEAYAKIKEKYEFAIIKYNNDEGASSYNKIEDKVPDLKRLKDNTRPVMSYDFICQCLSTVDRFDDLCVMPYMDGIEVSIDCLGFKDDIIAVPKYKLSGRHTKLDMDEEMIDICKKFYSHLKLESPFNLQIRYDKGIPYLLEVNLRLSGGSYKCREIGIDFPNITVSKFAGKLKELPKAIRQEILIGNVENCIGMPDVKGDNISSKKIPNKSNI